MSRSALPVVTWPGSSDPGRLAQPPSLLPLPGPREQPGDHAGSEPGRERRGTGQGTVQPNVEGDLRAAACGRDEHDVELLAQPRHGVDRDVQGFARHHPTHVEWDADRHAAADAEQALSLDGMARRTLDTGE